MKLVFDIETAPLDEAKDYIEPAEAPANYKDPEKIAAYVKEKTAESLGRCGLDLDLCRVVAIGWWRECDSEPIVVHAGSATSEAAMLRAFWNHAEDAHLVGFNCLSFDIPVLLRRSLYLGVKAPRISTDKYRHPDVTDLATDLSFNGAQRMRSLSFYMRRFEIPHTDTIKGSDIAALVAKGLWPMVESHCRADVEATAALARRLGHLSPAQEAAGAF